MKRTPLARHTPLTGGGSLARGGPIQRKTPPPRCRRTPEAAPPDPTARCRQRQAAKARREHDPGVTEDTRAQLLARCRGRCEACGRDLERGGVHVHHRKRRRDGGHTLDNLVVLHPTCHVVAPEAVHQRPAWARELGLIVRASADPASTPLTLPDGRTVLLSPDTPAYLAIN